jgi:parallel beta-helix repeat protein
VNCNIKDSAFAVFGSRVNMLEVYNSNIIADKQTNSTGMITCTNCNSSFVGNNKIYGSNATNFVCLSFTSSKGSIFNNYIQNCYYGLYLTSSYNGFSIYNNYFAKNTYDFSHYASCYQQWNIQRTSEINIIGGAEKGGNYWDKYTCVNIDGDSFCDDAYVLDTCNKDNLPLASAVTYYTVLPTVIQPFISPYTLFIALLAGMGVGLDFTAKAGGKVLLLVLVIGIMGAVYLSLFPSWILLVFIVVAGFMIAYMVIRFIGGAT